MNLPFKIERDLIIWCYRTRNT